MRPTDIEAWALSVLDRKDTNAQFEDDRVEHKQEWPTDYPKIARRVAGLCNAARGEPVLLIIGPDNQTANSSIDPADWFAKLEKEFDSVPPDHQHISFHHNGKPADAILFHTDRAPYVVRNPDFGTSGGGSIALEVPWRDGTRIRTARREDLIRILVPIAKLPSIHVAEVHGWLTGKQGADGLFKCRFEANVLVYIIPTSIDRIYLIQPNISIEIKIEPAPISVNIESSKLGGIQFYSSGTPYPAYSQERNKSETITVGAHELAIEGPGYAYISATGIFSSNQVPEAMDLRIALNVVPSEQSIPVTLVVTVNPKDEEGKFNLSLSS